ncbi:MAG: hypothetical protein K8R31_14650 [Bacteroidales bacterium]|nr:hypothetical protein [Bacteroidales bacterium]
MIKKITLSLFLMLSAYIINAQNDSSVRKLLDDYMDIVRKEVYSASPEKELYSKKNAGELLKLLNEYYTDTLAKVRSKAYYLTYKATYKSNDKELRNVSVFNLVQALKDEDSGNIGSAASWLTNFYSTDFNEASKDSLRIIMHKQSSYLDRIIKLVAFAGLNDQIEYLMNNLRNGNYRSSKVVWATHLALARLGVEEEINFCVDLVKKQAVNDDVIYELVPDLVYIRCHKAIDYLVEILQDETKNCYSANPENPQRIACGYRVMEFLAPIIKDFPLEVDSTGDLIVDDYEGALKIIREWFSEHADNYVIIKNSY